MKWKWPQLVRVVEVPKEIVIREVEVKIPVYKTFTVCNHEQRLDWIQAELAEIRRILASPLPEPISLRSDEEIIKGFARSAVAEAKILAKKQEQDELKDCKA